MPLFIYIFFSIIILLSLGGRRRWLLQLLRHGATRHFHGGSKGHRARCYEGGDCCGDGGGGNGDRRQTGHSNVTRAVRKYDNFLSVKKPPSSHRWLRIPCVWVRYKPVKQFSFDSANSAVRSYGRTDTHTRNHSSTQHIWNHIYIYTHTIDTHTRRPTETQRCQSDNSDQSARGGVRTAKWSDTNRHTHTHTLTLLRWRNSVPTRVAVLRALAAFYLLGRILIAVWRIPNVLAAPRDCWPNAHLRGCFGDTWPTNRKTEETQWKNFLLKLLSVKLN